MSSELVKVRAKTNWRKSKDHAVHRRGDVFHAPADWLPCPHLEVVDSGTREVDPKPEPDGGQGA